MFEMKVVRKEKEERLGVFFVGRRHEGTKARTHEGEKGRRGEGVSNVSNPRE